MALVDLTKIYALNSGTGALNLGQPVQGYRGVEALTNGERYSYSIQQDAAWEIGLATFLAGPNRLVRSPFYSSDGGTPINVAPGAAVAFVALSADILSGTLAAPLIGVGPPAANLGNLGQLYYDERPTGPLVLYGPKTAAGWGAGYPITGAIGPAGPANSTYATLAALKAAPATNLSYFLSTPLGLATYAYVAGDFTGKDDEFLVVGLNAVPLVTGALVLVSNGVPFTTFRLASDPAGDFAPTVQRAIDTVSAAGGGTVLIPVGTFPIKLRGSPDGTGAIAVELKSGVTLSGVSKAGSVLRLVDGAVGAGTYLRIIASFGALANAGLSNFTLDGNRDGQGLFQAQGNGGNIVLGRSLDLTIDNVISQNANGQCIQVSSPLPNYSERVVIKNCTVRNASGSSLNTDGSVSATYNGNGIGIQVSQCLGLMITGNIARNCHDNAIDTYSENGTTTPFGGSHLIQGNNVSDCRFGIFPETASQTLVSGNYITGMSDGGIAVNRINGAPTGIRVQGNMIGSVPVGIRVTGDSAPSNGVVIEQNTIYAISTGAGFGVQLGLDGGNVSYVTLNNNTFGVGSNMIPLVAVKGAQAAFISGLDNRFFGAPAAGYRLYNTATTSVAVFVDSFIGASDNSLPDLARQWGSFGKLAVSGTASADTLSVATKAGFFGATPVARQSIGAAATDAASTMTLANNIRTALIALGLGGA